MSYVPLHVHSQYSLLDGADSPEAYVLRAKELDIPSLSITDHGTLSGHREFYFAAKEHGVKPILGLEAYISSTDRFDKRAKKNRQDGTSVYNHITLLAKNAAGLDDLNRLSELAWSEGYYFKPRIDTELLFEYSNNLIVLSGCLNGLIAKSIEDDDAVSAGLWARDFKEVFGDRFFMEVQSHNPPAINHALLELADSMGIEPVMASDCHYARPEDLWIEEALLILATNPKVSPDADMSKAAKMDILDRFNYLYPDRQMTFSDLQLYLRDYATERQMFQAQGIDRTDIFENTNVISDMVEDNYVMPKSLDLLPAPKVDANERLQTLVERGLKRRGLDGKQEYIDRVEEELGVIKQKNFAAYFLILADMITWGKKQDILFGPGRGSAAGSLVLYAIGVTEVDPLKYNLLFSRFLNADRNDWPDVDQDIEDTRRGEVKDYLTRKFKNVASISTYSYFKDKGVVRDASRALSVPLGDVNKVLKTVETFEDFESSSETKWFRDKYPDVTKLSRALRGRIRSVGMHAAGLVIAKEPINKYAPIETRKDTQDESAPRVPVVAYDMDTAADIGLIKFDMLGLTTLSVINDAVKIIKERHGKDIVLTDIDLDDPAVLKDLSNGFTKAVFQAEAAPSTALLKRMGVEKFDHVVAANALVRPGAMDSIGPDYIARKQGRMSVPKIHPIYDEITKETFGAVLYQEQVMLLCNRLAGMSWSDADRIRKIIGKKKDVHEFDKFKDQFIDGASQHVNRAFAEKLWHDFEAHANYSFNKSHSVAYSMLIMWTAWLKHYYPLEFMCAALRNCDGKETKTDYLIEAKRLGIKVLMPHVNKSELEFSVDGDALRFGLSDIKFISTKVGKNIKALGEHHSYQSFVDAAARRGTGVNSRAVTALNLIGALRFPDNPLRGDEKDYMYEYLGVPNFNIDAVPDYVQKDFLMDFEESGVFVFVAMVKAIKRGKGWARVELVDDTGSAGIFHSERTQMQPGSLYLVLVSDNRILRYIDIEEIAGMTNDPFLHWMKAETLNIPHDKKVVIAFSTRETKAGKKMATVLLSKQDKELQSLLVFPKMFARALGKLKPGNVVSVTIGTLDDGTRFIKAIGD